MGKKTSLGFEVQFQKGYAFKSSWYRPEGHPVVRVSNFTDSSVDTSDLVFIPKEIAKDYVKYRLSEGDVVIQTVGSWPSNPASVVGKVIRIQKEASEALLNQNAVKLIPSASLDQRFLFFRLRNEDYRSYIVSTAQGAASQASITLDSIRAFEFVLPALSNQRRIASILSAYDDLIENNTRRIKILEEMAQMIYREWFVHFRFPGHEKVRMVESELGPIPEGWSVGAMETVCQRVTDGSHWSPKTVESGRPMASSKDLHKWGLNLSSCRWISEEDFDELVRNDCRPLAGDVLITKDGANYLKYCFCVEKDMDVVLLSSVAMIRPDSARASSHYIAFHLSEESVKTRLAGRVSGAAIPRIVLKDFRQFTISIPPIDLQRRFDQVVQPLVALCWRLIDKNVNLRTTRDLLLPKLISGEIPVEAAAELMEQTA